MNKEKIAASLRALAADENKRSKAARLRDVFDEVEATLAAGVTRADVLQVLNAQGLDMSMATFDSTMARLRAQRKAYSTSPLKRAATAASPPAPGATLQADSEAATPAPDRSAPGTIEAIARTTPDLDSLAKHAKGK